MRAGSGIVAALVAALCGCAQFTTSKSERASLESAATQAADAYLGCVVDASDRYLQTGESAALIVEMARKGCAGERDHYEQAQSTFLATKYMRSGPIVKSDLAALDERATRAVNERVMERKVASQPVAISPAAGTAAAAATVAVPATRPTPTVPPAEATAYLDCMRQQGQRYASVDDSAAAIAEVAHSRCAAKLSDPATAAQIEREGRNLVMGMVLDHKAGQ